MIIGSCSDLLTVTADSIKSNSYQRYLDIKKLVTQFSNHGAYDILNQGLREMIKIIAAIILFFNYVML